jgi:hypothetical protein
MENKDIRNINEFFTKDEPELTPEQKWERIFDSWITKIDQKKLMTDLIELKCWFEGLEEFFSSTYLENLIFKYQAIDSRNYQIYVLTFTQVAGKIINHLKTLDFEKDKFFLNFEEFIVEKFLENHPPKSFPYLKDVYSPESWFYSLRVFLQNLKNIAQELGKNDIISIKTFSSLKRLYRKELTDNSIVISLLKGMFIPKMDKIYQHDVCDIILGIKDKKLKKDIGIIFILAFRILRINSFIDVSLNKNRNIGLTIPLILALQKNLDRLTNFYENSLKKTAANAPNNEQTLILLEGAFNSLTFEYKKIFFGELPYYFEVNNEKINKRKLLKNVSVISDFATQHLVESVAKIYKPGISGEDIFAGFISREQMTTEVKKKLETLYRKIGNYLSQKGNISSSDIFFDINLFVETDLNYLLYKDWSEFLKFYDDLVNSDFTPEYKNNLRGFQSFIARILKEIAEFKIRNIR